MDVAGLILIIFLESKRDSCFRCFIKYVATIQPKLRELQTYKFGIIVDVGQPTKCC